MGEEPATAREGDEDIDVDVDIHEDVDPGPPPPPPPAPVGEGGGMGPSQRFESSACCIDDINISWLFVTEDVAAAAAAADRPLPRPVTLAIPLARPLLWLLVLLIVVAEDGEGREVVRSGCRGVAARPRTGGASLREGVRTMVRGDCGVDKTISAQEGVGEGEGEGFDVDIVEAAADDDDEEDDDADAADDADDADDADAAVDAVVAPGEGEKVELVAIDVVRGVQMSAWRCC